MRSWNETPVLRLLPFCIGGILAGLTFEISRFVLFASLSISLSSFLLCYYFVSRRYSGIRVFMLGLTSFLLMFILFINFTFLNTQKNYPFHFRNSDRSESFLAVIQEAPKEKGSSYRCEAEILQERTDHIWKVVDGKVLIYFYKDGLKDIPAYGDRIVFTKKPEEVKEPLNPEQFNFKKWLSSHQVYDQLNLKQGEFIITEHHKATRLVEWAIGLRDQWIRVFQENEIKGQEYAVLSALILGYDDEINQETMQAYAASGALHILSVSGMHLGIIYGALQALLSFLSRHKKLRLLRSIIVILFLWFYALLTGLSPSVLRSAMMLTFIVIGQTLDRSTNTYNTLGASMLALFVFFSPHLILQAGFQLSYLAVGGILFLYKFIENKLYFKSWLGKQIWSILSVSIAAQVATFPLSLYYFHQFPNYFLPSNLVVIPISTAVIFGGILLLLFSSWTFAAIKIAWIAGKLVWALNFSVYTVEQLPYSLIQNVYVSEWSLVFWYLSLLFLSIYFKEARKVFFWLSGIAITTLLSLQLMREIGVREQEKIVVYHLPKQTCIQLIDGRTGFLLADSFCIANSGKRKMLTVGYEIKSGISEERNTILSFEKCDTTFSDGNQFAINSGRIQFGEIRLDILHPSNQKKEHVSDAEYLLISHNYKPPVLFALKYPKCRMVILDGGNSEYRSKQWKKLCEENTIQFYSTSREGAFLLEPEKSANF